MVCTVERIARKLESRGRRRHSRGTARLAARLSARFGADPAGGYLAGLAHDLARELPDGQLLELAGADGRPIRSWERERPVLLHGRAAAELLRRERIPAPPEVLEAVAEHVTGRPGMGLLARIVFVADYLEPGRGFVDAGWRKRLMGLSLEAMLAGVLESVFGWLRREGLPVAPPARELYEELTGHAASQA
jgi:predicted HD superfamily hydrolase involved in NAD metabolism